ncbi:hypothetical protein Tco_0887448, partial [Tanacetum coccineum]
ELISGLATGQNTRSEPFLNLKAAVDYKDVALGGEVGLDAALLLSPNTQLP